LNRRDLLTRSAGTAIIWPLIARAQQAAMPVIGYLHSGSPGPLAAEVAAFRRGLAEGGYVEGQNISIEYRWAEGEKKHLPGSGPPKGQRYCDDRR
jgi:putative ABC transport system substrate-binding protein